LEHCVDSKKEIVLDEIKKCHKILLDDQYGNYVIQHVLQYGRNLDRDSVLRIVVESGLLSLSKQKFASNVVEKLLKFGTPAQRKTIVREMLKVRKSRQPEACCLYSSQVQLIFPIVLLPCVHHRRSMIPAG
jgi:pumilio RNA-binding family